MVIEDSESVEEPEPSPYRRLIIVVVEPGQDPEVEHDPPESFAPWEAIAALKRAIEIMEEEDILAALPLNEEDEDE